MKKSKRIIATFTAIFFLVTQIWSPSQGWAAINPAAVSEVKLPAAFQLELPPDLGKIEKIVSGSGPTVVHLQTAHGNYEAQVNIKNILRYLTRQHGIKLLFLEGASGKLSPELYHLFDDPALNRELADLLMRDAEFSGAEHFLLENSLDQDSRVAAFGIEDPELYRDDLHLFREVLMHKESTAGFLKISESRVGRISTNVLSSDMLKAVREWRRFQMSGGLMRYARFLAKEAKHELGMDLSDALHQNHLPQLVRLTKLHQVEAELDRKAIEAERQTMNAFLRTIPEGETFIAPLERMTTGNAREGDNIPTELPRYFFERLHDAAEPFGFRMSAYPELARLGQYLILRSEMDALTLFEEIETLTNQLFDALAKTEMEREIARLFKDIFMLRKIFRLELKREDFLMIESDIERYRPTTLLAQIEAHTPFGVEGVTTEELERFFDQALSFYRLAARREDAFLERMVTIARKRKKDRFVVITGGFHSEGIKTRFKERGLSYMEIAPRITNILPKEGDNYLQAMLATRKSALQFSQISKVLTVLNESNWAERLIEMSGDDQYPLYVAEQIVEKAIRVVPDAAALLSMNKSLLAKLTALTFAVDQAVPDHLLVSMNIKTPAQVLRRTFSVPLRSLRSDSVAFSDAFLTSASSLGTGQPKKKASKIDAIFPDNPFWTDVVERADRLHELGHMSDEMRAEFLDMGEFYAEDLSVPIKGQEPAQLRVFRARHNYVQRKLSKRRKQRPGKGGLRMLGPGDFASDHIFMEGLRKVQEAGGTLEDANRYMKHWAEQMTRALSVDMTRKIALMDLLPKTNRDDLLGGGGKGSIVLARIIEKDGKFVPAGLFGDRRPTNIEMAQVARSFSRKLAENGLVGVEIDVPAPDRGTDSVFMGWMLDEFFKYHMEIELKLWREERAIERRLSNLREREARLSQIDQYLLEEEREALNKAQEALAKSKKKNKTFLQKYDGLIEFIMEEYDPVREAQLNKTPLVDLIYTWSLMHGIPVRELGTYTGKPVMLGGQQARAEATGAGAMISSMLIAEKIMNMKDGSLDGVEVAVQGFGNAGQYIALLLKEKGAKIVAVSDFSGGIYKKHGFSMEELQNMIAVIRDRKLLRQYYDTLPDKKKTAHEERYKYPQNVDWIERDSYLTDLPFVHLLLPAALEHVITEDNADDIKALSIVAVANGPTTMGAETKMWNQKKDRPTYIVSDIFASGGGVVVSYDEMAEAKTGKYELNRATTLARLEAQMRDTFEKIWALIDREAGIDFGLAADIVTVNRIKASIESLTGVAASLGVTHEMGAWGGLLEAAGQPARAPAWLHVFLTISEALRKLTGYWASVARAVMSSLAVKPLEPARVRLEIPSAIEGAAASLGDQAENAAITEQFAEHPLWQDVRNRLTRLRSGGHIDAAMEADILEMENIYKRELEVSLETDKPTVTFKTWRVRHNLVQRQAAGRKKRPAKGGTRALNAASLKNNKTFMRALRKIKEAGGTVEDANRFLDQWSQELTQALAVLMTRRIALMNLLPSKKRQNLLGGGAKGLILTAEIVEENGAFVPVPVFGNREASIVETARIARITARALVEDGIVGIDIDVPSTEKGTNSEFISIMLDEHFKYWLEIEKDLHDKQEILNYEEKRILSRIETAATDELKQKHEASYEGWKQRNQDLASERKTRQTPLAKYDHLVELLISNYDPVRAAEVDKSPLVDLVYKYSLLFKTPVKELGAYTAKPRIQGGHYARAEADGHGAAFAAKLLLQKLYKGNGRILKGRKMAVQGFGNIGSYLALILAGEGANVVAISDSSGGIYKQVGFSKEDIQDLIKAARDGKDLKHYFDEMQDWEKARDPNEFHHSWRVQWMEQATYLEEVAERVYLDVLFLAEQDHAVHKSNANIIRAQSVIGVANGSISMSAETLLWNQKKGIPIYVVPDIFGGSAAVLISEEELEQNRSGKYVVHKQTALNKLDKQMEATFEELWELVDRDQGISPGYAADILAMQRIQASIKAVTDASSLGETISSKEPKPAMTARWIDKGVNGLLYNFISYYESVISPRRSQIRLERLKKGMSFVAYWLTGRVPMLPRTYLSYFGDNYQIQMPETAREAIKQSLAKMNHIKEAFEQEGMRTENLAFVYDPFEWGALAMNTDVHRAIAHRKAIGYKLWRPLNLLYRVLIALLRPSNNFIVSFGPQLFMDRNNLEEGEIENLVAHELWHAVQSSKYPEFSGQSVKRRQMVLDHPISAWAQQQARSGLEPVNHLNVYLSEYHVARMKVDEYGKEGLANTIWDFENYMKSNRFTKKGKPRRPPSALSALRQLYLAYLLGYQTVRFKAPEIAEKQRQYIRSSYGEYFTAEQLDIVEAFLQNEELSIWKDLDITLEDYEQYLDAVFELFKDSRLSEGFDARYAALHGVAPRVPSIEAAALGSDPGFKIVFGEESYGFWLSLIKGVFVPKKGTDRLLNLSMLFQRLVNSALYAVKALSGFFLFKEVHFNWPFDYQISHKIRQEVLAKVSELTGLAELYKKAELVREPIALFYTPGMIGSIAAIANARVLEERLSENESIQDFSKHFYSFSRMRLADVAYMIGVNSAWLDRDADYRTNTIEHELWHPLVDKVLENSGDHHKELTGIVTEHSTWSAPAAFLFTADLREYQATRFKLEVGKAVGLENALFDFRVSKDQWLRNLSEQNDDFGAALIGLFMVYMRGYRAFLNERPELAEEHRLQIRAAFDPYFEASHFEAIETLLQREDLKLWKDNTLGAPADLEALVDALTALFDDDSLWAAYAGKNQISTTVETPATIAVSQDASSLGDATTAEADVPVPLLEPTITNLMEGEFTSLEDALVEFVFSEGDAMRDYDVNQAGRNLISSLPLPAANRQFNARRQLISDFMTLTTTYDINVVDLKNVEPWDMLIDDESRVILISRTHWAAISDKRDIVKELVGLVLDRFEASVEYVAKLENQTLKRAAMDAIISAANLKALGDPYGTRDVPEHVTMMLKMINEVIQAVAADSGVDTEGVSGILALIEKVPLTPDQLNILKTAIDAFKEAANAATFDALRGNAKLQKALTALNRSEKFNLDTVAGELHDFSLEWGSLPAHPREGRGPLKKILPFYIEYKLLDLWIEGLSAVLDQDFEAMRAMSIEKAVEGRIKQLRSDNQKVEGWRLHKAQVDAVRVQMEQAIPEGDAFMSGAFNALIRETVDHDTEAILEETGTRIESWMRTFRNQSRKIERDEKAARWAAVYRERMAALKTRMAAHARKIPVIEMIFAQSMGAELNPIPTVFGTRLSESVFLLNHEIYALMRAYLAPFLQDESPHGRRAISWLIFERALERIDPALAQEVQQAIDTEHFDKVLAPFFETGGKAVNFIDEQTLLYVTPASREVILAQAAFRAAAQTLEDEEHREALQLAARTIFNPLHEVFVMENFDFTILDSGVSAALERLEAILSDAVDSQLMSLRARAGFDEMRAEWGRLYRQLSARFKAQYLDPIPAFVGKRLSDDVIGARNEFIVAFNAAYPEGVVEALSKEDLFEHFDAVVSGLRNTYADYRALAWYLRMMLDSGLMLINEFTLQGGPTKHAALFQAAWSSVLTKHLGLIYARVLAEPIRQQILKYGWIKNSQVAELHGKIFGVIKATLPDLPHLGYDIEPMLATLLPAAAKEYEALQAAYREQYASSLGEDERPQIDLSGILNQPIEPSFQPIHSALGVRLTKNIFVIQDDIYNIIEELFERVDPKVSQRTSLMAAMLFDALGETAPATLRLRREIGNAFELAEALRPILEALSDEHGLEFISESEMFENTARERLELLGRLTFQAVANRIEDVKDRETLLQRFDRISSVFDIRVMSPEPSAITEVFSLSMAFSFMTHLSAIFGVDWDDVTPRDFMIRIGLGLPSVGLLTRLHQNIENHLENAGVSDSVYVTFAEMYDDWLVELGMAEQLFQQAFITSVPPEVGLLLNGDILLVRREIMDIMQSLIADYWEGRKKYSIHPAVANAVIPRLSKVAANPAAEAYLRRFLMYPQLFDWSILDDDMMVHASFRKRIFLQSAWIKIVNEVSPHGRAAVAIADRTAYEVIAQAEPFDRDAINTRISQRLSAWIIRPGVPSQPQFRSIIARVNAYSEQLEAAWLHKSPAYLASSLGSDVTDNIGPEHVAALKTWLQSNQVEPDLYTADEMERLAYRAAQLDQQSLGGIYARLTRAGRRALIYPSFLLLALGIKPGYVSTYEDEVSLDEILTLVAEFKDIPEVWNQWAISFGGPAMALESTAERALTGASFLAKHGVLTDSEARQLRLDAMDYRRSLGSFEAGINLLSEKALELYKATDDVGVAMRHALNGFMLGYPLADIEYRISQALLGKHGRDDFATATVESKYGLHLVSPDGGSAEAKKLLRKWDVALDYAYSRLVGLPDFADLAADLNLPVASSLGSATKEDSLTERERIAAAEKAAIVHAIVLRLSPRARQVILQASLIPVLLGLKTGYVSSSSDVDHAGVLAELQAAFNDNEELDVFISEDLVINVGLLKQRLKEDREFLIEVGAATDGIMNGIDSALTGHEFSARVEAWYRAHIDTKEEDIVAGVLADVSREDIVFAVDWLKEHDLFDPQTDITGPYRLRINSLNEAAARAKITRWAEGVAILYAEEYTVKVRNIKDPEKLIEKQYGLDYMAAQLGLPDRDGRYALSEYVVLDILSIYDVPRAVAASIALTSQHRFDSPAERTLFAIQQYAKAKGYQVLVEGRALSLVNPREAGFIPTIIGYLDLLAAENIPAAQLAALLDYVDSEVEGNSHALDSGPFTDIIVQADGIYQPLSDRIHRYFTDAIKPHRPQMREQALSQYETLLFWYQRVNPRLRTLVNARVPAAQVGHFLQSIYEESRNAAPSYDATSYSGLIVTLENDFSPFSENLLAAFRNVDNEISQLIFNEVLSNYQYLEQIKTWETLLFKAAEAGVAPSQVTAFLENEINQVAAREIKAKSISEMKQFLEVMADEYTGLSKLVHDQLKALPADHDRYDYKTMAVWLYRKLLKEAEDRARQGDAAEEEAGVPSEAGSLGEQSQVVQAYFDSRPEGTHNVETALIITRDVAGNVIDYSIVEAAPDVFEYLYALLLINKEQQRAGSEASVAVRAFNQDISAALKALQISEYEGGISLVLGEDVLAIPYAGREEQAVARNLARLLENGHITYLWDFAKNEGHKPNLVQQLYKLAKTFSVKAVPFETVGTAGLDQYSSKKDLPALAIASREDALMLNFEGAKIRMDADFLKQHQLDPLRVLALLKQVGEQEDRRGELFYQMGLSFNPEGNYWSVGEGFLNFINDLYAAAEAQHSIAIAA